VVLVEDVSITAPDEERAVLEHASRLLPCPKEHLSTRQISLSKYPHLTFFVDGCGQRLVYASVMRGRVAMAIIARFPLAPLPP
jgi:hypothetical protein